MTLEHNPGTLPENWKEDDRWFCFAVPEATKIPRAPWLNEHPEEGYSLSWDSNVGYNWKGVPTDLDTAKKWADHPVTDWSLATRIPDYDDDFDGVRDILIDLDDVVDPETGDIHPQAKKIIERADSYAAYSHSWTGIHVYIRGRVPDGYTLVIDTDLEPTAEFPEAELEVYPQRRFVGTTARHVPDMPTKVNRNQPFIDLLYESFGGAEDSAYEDAGGEGVADREPTHTKTETRTTETTGDIELVYDAISHTSLRDIRLRSELTEERHGGAKSFDPSWETSESGTRLGYEDGGFIYRKGMVGLDILQVVALEEGIIKRVGKYPEGEDFWSAVEALRDRGADIPEYDPSERHGGYTSLLPDARLSKLDPKEQRRYAQERGIPIPSVHEARERLSREVEEALKDGDSAVISAPTGVGKTTTVSMEPWLSSDANPDGLPTIVASGTHDARDEAVEESEKHGVDYAVLKGRKELCPVCAGEYDPANIDEEDPDSPEPVLIDGQPASEWIDFWCDERGHPISHVHKWAEESANRPLPCEQDGTECAVKGQFDKIPRTDEGNCEYDVIHCTYQFLLVPSMRMHTNIFIDEKPSFTDNIDPQVVRQSVNAHLAHIDAPVDSYTELVYASQHGVPPGIDSREHFDGLTRGEYVDSFKEEMDEALSDERTTVECPRCDGNGEAKHTGEHSHDLSEFDVVEEEGTDGDCPTCYGRGSVPKREANVGLRWFRDHPEAHILAPAFTRAIWNAEERAGGRKHARVRYNPPRLDDSNKDKNAWNQVQIDVVLDDQWEVEEVAGIPDFTLANAVVGLDAHPQPRDPHWMTMVDEDIETRRIFDTEERALYRRYERGLFTVQVGEGIQPVTTGEYWSDGMKQKARAIIKSLENQYGEEFDSAVTSKRIRSDFKSLMDEICSAEPEMMHYGNEKSRNDFAGKGKGLVFGSIDPGDGMIMNRLARLGLDAEPAYKQCPKCNGSGEVGHDEEDPDDDGICPTCMGEGELREKGRTFVGEDADMAEAVLRGVREHHVAQAAGRWARDADDPDDGAVVYVVTEATPVGFIDAQVPGTTWVANPDQRDRLEYVRDQPDGATGKEIAEEFDCSKKAAWRTLTTAEEEGLVERTPGEGPSNADIYWPGGEFNPHGSASLRPSDDGTVTDHVRDTTTFTVTVNTHPRLACDLSPEEVGDWLYQSTFEWFEDRLRPPP